MLLPCLPSNGYIYLIADSALPFNKLLNIYKPTIYYLSAYLSTHLSTDLFIYIYIYLSIILFPFTKLQINFALLVSPTLQASKKAWMLNFPDILTDKSYHLILLLAQATCLPPKMSDISASIPASSLQMIPLIFKIPNSL